MSQGSRYFSLPIKAWQTGVLALLFIVAVVERVYGIDRQSLWSDELFAVTASYKPFLEGMWSRMISDSHPPGYILFMYATLPLSGYSDFGIRFHALIFGIAWVPLVFMLARRWFSVPAALLAAALLASAYNAVYYSQEARAYTMFIAFNLWNVICFLEILFSDQQQRQYRTGFIVSMVAMLYLHYAGFVFFCAQGLLVVVLLIMGHSQTNLKRWVFLFAVPLLLYAPWLGIMYNNLVHAPRDWSVSQVPTLTEVYNTMQRLLGPDDAQMRLYVWAIGLAPVVAVVQHWRRGLSQAVIAVYCLMFLMVVPVVAFYVESLIATPIFEKRYFLMSLALATVLLGWLGAELFTKWSERSTAVITVLLVVLLTMWTISTNLSSGLYHKLDKDPVREAVAIIKQDLGKNPHTRYTTVMTHDWFEHYLNQAAIDYDKNWVGRRYYVPQQFIVFDSYFNAHPDITYLYYLALRQPNAEAALVSLKQSYHLVSQASVSIEAGTLDVFKFNVRERPDAEQLKTVGSNPSNEVARLVGEAVRQKDPATYRVLMTHTWVKPYFARNGVVIDPSWDTSYVINAQADSVYRYMEKNPQVDTLFYLALQEPNAEGAELMLQLRYRLVSEATIVTSVGPMSVLQFNVKEAPVLNDSVMQRMRASQTYQVVEQLQRDIGQAAPESLAIAVANAWIEPYLKLSGLPIDERWDDRRYYLPAAVDRVAEYIKQRPAVATLYYVALRESSAEQAAQALQKRYKLEQQLSISVAAGTVDIYRFNTKTPL